MWSLPALALSDSQGFPIVLVARATVMGVSWVATPIHSAYALRPGKTEDMSMVVMHETLPMEPEPLVHSVERRMQDIDDDVERARRELDRLRLYRDVVKRLNSPDALMPEVIRSHGLGL